MIGQFSTNQSLGTTPSNPVAVDAAGNVYGESTYGGSTDDGVLWEVPVGSTTVQTLAVFNGADGAQPEGGMIFDSAGNLFGTTNAGGTDNFGTVFEIQAGTTAVTTVASFSTTGTGQGFGNPTGGLAVDGSGDLFGVGPIGVQSGNGDGTQNGAVFEIRAGSHAITRLATFVTATDGADDEGAPALDSAGNLWGATSTGGAGGNGVLWEYKRGASSLTVVDDFSTTTGIDPQTSVVFDAAGNLYGTATLDGGSTNGFGSVWELPAGATGLTLRAALDNSADIGSSPSGALAVDAAGNVFFGASTSATPGNGTVLELPAGSSTIESLHTLTVSTDGGQFIGGVTLGINGNLYGATNTGSTSADGQGTVFRLVPTAAAAKLAFGFQPADVLAGAIASSITVNVEDTTGTVVATDTSTVTLGIATGPAGALIGGTTTAAVVNGVATFDAVSFATPGTYTLTVTDAALTPATSTAFIVSNNVAANGAVAPAVTGLTAPGTVVPGDTVAVAIALTNTGATPARGAARGIVTLTDDDSTTDGVATAAPSLNHIAVNLAAGATRSYSAKFAVPIGLPAGTYRVVLSLAPIQGFANGSVSTTPVLGDVTFTVTTAFGTLSGRRGVRFVTTGAGGARITYALAGPGSGVLTTAADGSESVALTGTSTASRWVVTSAGRVAVPLTAVTDDAAIGVIAAPTVQLSGALDLPGGARSVQLGSVSSGTITLGGSTPATLSLGAVAGSSLFSDAPINALTATGWTGTILAPSIKTLTINGSLSADIATASINTFTVRGDVTGSAVLVGATFGPDRTLGGGDDTFAAGTIHTLRVTGSVTNDSVIAAGINLASDALPVTAADTLLSGGSINAVVINGSVDGGAYVLAAALPAKLRVAGQAVNSDIIGFELPT